MLRPTLARITDLVLTTHPVRRGDLSVWLISVTTYLLYILIMWVQVGLGFTPPKTAAVLMGCTSVVNTLLYLGIRRGWGPSFDRRLGITQLLVGIVFMWMSYATAGPAGVVTVIIVASHIVYAMFSMPPRQVWQVVIFSLIGLAVTMLVCHERDPLNYRADVQLVTYLYTSLVVVLIARLAVLVARMNEGLRSKSRELAQALEKVRHLATRDDLTQVHNRRHITELMGIEQHQHERSGSPLCLALLDIDLFKSVNDVHGHQAGDEVLRRFAQAMQQALRTSDLLGRWGGEEFVVVFPDTGLAEARVALGRVREQLCKTDFSHVGQALAITFSAGLVQMRVGEDMESGIERADQAMYRAKTGGRDRVVTDERPAGSHDDAALCA
jgi:diguanylate cyclase (GGDEF)-like protein